MKKLILEDLKKNNNIKFFSTNDISKNLSESSFDFTWANAPVLIGVVLLGAVVGAGLGYLFNTYVFKKPGVDPKSDSVEPTTVVDLNTKPDSVELITVVDLNQKPAGSATELGVDSKGLNDLSFDPRKNFPGFADNEFCVFESHEALIEGIPLINQRSFINNFYSWIESSNLTEDFNWVQLYQLLHRVYIQSQFLELDRKNNKAVILELEEKFGALLDGFIDIQKNGEKSVPDAEIIQIFFDLIQEDIDLSLTLISLNQNSINIYFTLFYFIFLILSLGHKHFVFDWVKIKILLKFYRLFLFFKT